MAHYAYIMASQKNGTLYIGVTKDLIRRVYEHKQGLIEGFAKRYCVMTLVYFESYDRTKQAIRRERTLKRWRRDWKIALIERDNPHWDDLYDRLCR